MNNVDELWLMISNMTSTPFKDAVYDPLLSKSLSVTVVWLDAGEWLSLLSQIVFDYDDQMKIPFLKDFIKSLSEEADTVRYVIFAWLLLNHNLCYFNLFVFPNLFPLTFLILSKNYRTSFFIIGLDWILRWTKIFILR
jgi:hypothetical protein